MLTITRIGYVTVTDLATGLQLSQHADWDEALERAVNLPPGSESEIRMVKRVHIPAAPAPAPAPSALGFTSRFTVGSSVTDAQGVATDGTSLWYSNSSTLRKYDKAGNLLASRNVMADAPLDKQQINGLHWHAGRLYVSAAKVINNVATSWVVEYDPATLLPIESHPLGKDAFSEGVAARGGHWWVCFHASKFVAEYDAAWAHVADHALTFPISGPAHGYGASQGYDALAWVGDYLLLNIHEIYAQDYVDCYRWTGAAFDEVARLQRATTRATQGMAVDPVEPGILWWAERNYSGADGIARGSIA